MKATEYARLAALERTYWWHLGRLKIIEGYIRRANKNSQRPAILNVGCGTGGTVDMLEAFGRTDNVDTSPEAIKFMQQRGYTRVTKVEGLRLPYADKTYDIVAVFDVLEHIDQQVEALREWKRVLKDTGAIIITVPAYQWLWSDHDEVLHHKRRYTAKRLTRAVEAAGLQVEKKSYAFTFALPLIIGFRLATKVASRNFDPKNPYVTMPSWLNRWFTKFLYAEARWHAIMSFPAGTSVIAVVRKPA